MDTDYRYIDTAQGLEALCRELSTYNWFTLDTEFIRERTYAPRLCLLQVATPDTVACIDPLALADLEPLRALLFDSRITKVLHAAFQDLEIFFHLYGKVPAPIFDTQIAATLLGHGDQIGYGNLVRAELGIELAKGHARTDWCQRPLDDDQLNYAADDVRYLCDIYERQIEALVKHGRLEWLDEDFATLTSAETYANPPQQAWRRVKGAGRLKGVQPTVLRALAAWREQRAQERDKPRRWIVKDDPLLDLARQMPGDSNKMSRIRGLDDTLIKRHGEELLAIIDQAKQTPKTEWLAIEQGPRLSPQQEPLVDLLMAQLRELCRQQRITPSAVTGRRELEKLVMGERDLPLMHGWRGALAGKQLAALLDGRLSLRVVSNHLVAETRND